MRASDQDQECGAVAHTGSRRLDRGHSSDTDHHQHSSRSSSKRNRRDHYGEDCHQCEDWDGDRSQSFKPAMEEDWDKDQDRAQTSLKDAHYAYGGDQNHSNCTDDQAAGHDYYSGPPEPQPGSYPCGEQHTSRNTTYED